MCVCGGGREGFESGGWGQGVGGKNVKLQT